MQVSLKDNSKGQKRDKVYEDDDDVHMLPNIQVGDLSKRMSKFRQDRAEDPRKTVTSYRTRKHGGPKADAPKSEGTVRKALSAARQEAEFGMTYNINKNKKKQKLKEGNKAKGSKAPKKGGGEPKKVSPIQRILLL